MILRHCQNCGEPMRRVAGDDQAMRCVACTPAQSRRLRTVVDVTPTPTVPAPPADPANRVAQRAIETAQLLASLTPGEGGTHEGEARTLAGMAGGDVTVLRRAMKLALAQQDSTVSTIAGSLLLHAYEVAAGLRLR